jgi:hypothetical protein
MSMLVYPNIGVQIRPSYHAVLILQIDRECSRYNMVKDTCLAAPQRRTGNPQKLGPGSPRRTVLVQRYLS